MKIAGFIKKTLIRSYQLWKDFRLPKKIIKGQNVRIYKSAQIECRFGGLIELGNNTFIEEYAMLLTYGGKISLGENCGVGPFSVIYGHGGVSIGCNVLIATHTVMIPSNHNFSSIDKPIREQGNKSIGITIEDDVWIGAGVKILDGVVIGKGSIIGAGAVVTSSCQPYSIMVGVPARIIKSRK